MKYNLDKLTIRDENKLIVAHFSKGNEEDAERTCSFLNAIKSPRNKPKNDFVRVSIHMMIDGFITPMKEVEYERGRETVSYTLEDLGRIIFFWEKMFCGGITYAMDGFLQKAEKKLAKRDNETAQSVFEKYWINTDKSAEDEFNELNKGGEDSIFPALNDYLLYGLASKCESFSDSTMLMKQGFLYWLFNYVFNGEFQEMADDLNQIPESIKELVDNRLMEKVPESDKSN